MKKNSCVGHIGNDMEANSRLKARKEVDRSDSKTLHNLTKMLLDLQKSSNNDMPKKHKSDDQNNLVKPTSTTPIARRLARKNIVSQSNKINTWLSKEGVKSKALTKYELCSKSTKNKNKENCDEKIVKKIKITTEDEAKNNNKEKLNTCSSKMQLNLGVFVDKRRETKKHSSSHNTHGKRSESTESVDFPSFRQKGKKSKSNKSDCFRKYGIILPSVDEILKDKKDLEQHKKQIELFKEFEDQTFELPVFAVQKSEENQLNILDCKHLSKKLISKAFKRNFNYISDIFNGKKYCERHERFYNYNNVTWSLTTKDLSYNTSMIVFTFEQKDHMLKLMRDKFDPDDKLTRYFFQVLLPELCLKIFMDTHEMTCDEASQYLDKRPIVDD